jgi:hypothetical protein
VKASYGSIRHFQPPERSYTRVPNSLIVAEISATAYRVASYLLSHRDGFRVTNELIATGVHVSLRTVVTVLTELEGSRYLVRTPVMVGGRRAGTDYLISGYPIPDGAETAPTVDAEIARSDSAKTAPRKKTGSYKTNNTNLSEGDTAAAAPVDEIEDVLEEDVKLKPPADAPTLFEVAAPPKKKRKDKPEPSKSQAVVAAYADSYLLHHNQQRPLRSDLAKVGAAAKLILTREEATQEELVRAATRMGRGEWSNLLQELKFSRRATSGQGISAPAPRHDAPIWDEMERQTRADVPDMTDDELAEIFGVKA